MQLQSKKNKAPAIKVMVAKENKHYKRETMQRNQLAAFFKNILQSGKSSFGPLSWLHRPRLSLSLPAQCSLSPSSLTDGCHYGTMGTVLKECQGCKELIA